MKHFFPKEGALCIFVVIKLGSSVGKCYNTIQMRVKDRESENFNKVMELKSFMTKFAT